MVDAIRSGYTLGLHNGEEMVVRKSQSVKNLLAAMFSVDEERLYLYVAGKAAAEGCIFLVYGNSGWDVVNDYSGKLEPLLARAGRWSDRLSEVCS